MDRVERPRVQHRCHGRSLGQRSWAAGVQAGRAHERHHGTAVALRLVTTQPTPGSIGRSDSSTGEAGGERRAAPASRRRRTAGRAARGRTALPAPSSHRITSARTTVRAGQARRARGWPRSAATAARSRSTKVHARRPRDSASMPSAPLPANRSAHRALDRPRRGVASALKVASRTRSVVGRVVGARAAPPSRTAPRRAGHDAHRRRTVAVGPAMVDRSCGSTSPRSATPSTARPPQRLHDEFLAFDADPTRRWRCSPATTRRSARAPTSATSPPARRPGRSARPACSCPSR